MKYRKTPEDFIVEEVADHKILKKGAYKLFTLEKEGIETFELLNFISKENSIPRKDIGIAGMKDTHARTIQYVTVPQRYDIEELEDVEIKFLGYLNNPIRLGDLTANRFIITIREIEEDEMQIALENAKTIKYGIPNYFDNQRFGSVSDNQFIAKHIIKKDYESAVKQYLTTFTPYDRLQIITDKQNILASWPTFDTEIESHSLRSVTDEYKKTKNWIRVFKKMPPPLRMFYVAAYQSYIWNECVKTLLMDKVEKEKLYSVPYALGELTFYNEKIDDIPKTIQKISHKIIPEKYEKEVIEQVLKREGL
jgi:tRNA pseudouridine13 synthase